MMYNTLYVFCFPLLDKCGALLRVQHVRYSKAIK